MSKGDNVNQAAFIAERFGVVAETQQKNGEALFLVFLPVFLQHSLRAGIKSTISQAARVSNLHQARYLRLPKTTLQHVITATAINVRRIVSWLVEPSLRPTRVSRFAALAVKQRKQGA